MRLSREKLEKREVNIAHLVKELIDQVLEETMGRDILWQLGSIPVV